MTARPDIQPAEIPAVRFCPVCGKRLDGSQAFSRVDGGWPACPFPCANELRRQYDYRERLKDGILDLNARIRDAAIRGLELAVWADLHTEGGMSQPRSYQLFRFEISTLNPLE